MYTRRGANALRRLITMFNIKFGIEIELTGITRAKAAQVVAKELHATTASMHDHYDTRRIQTSDGRIWKTLSDASIHPEHKEGGQNVVASQLFKVELVSPILTYAEDIDTVQRLVRVLRAAGGFTNESCGIHIHLDGADHSVRSIRNFINIIASKNDLLYNALEIKPERMRYCQKMDDRLVERFNSVKPKTMEAVENIWYEGHSGQRDSKYHVSRYALLNLHSFFTGNHTVELRGFNSTLHAGKIRSYIILALALNHQALTQRSASPRKVQATNPKFAMRTYLNRIGLIGKAFENCREHLTKALAGLAAWRFRAT
jgi:hypothetical protein